MRYVYMVTDDVGSWPLLRNSPEPPEWARQEPMVIVDQLAAMPDDEAEELFDALAELAFGSPRLGEPDRWRVPRDLRPMRDVYLRDLEGQRQLWLDRSEEHARRRALVPTSRLSRTPPRKPRNSLLRIMIQSRGSL